MKGRTVEVGEKSEYKFDSAAVEVSMTAIVAKWTFRQL